MATQGAGFAGAIGHRSAYLARVALLAVAFGLGLLPITAASLTLQTAKSFKPSAINSGGKSILTISLTNNDVVNSAAQVGLTDTFPAGMTLDIGAQTNTCGGSLSSQQGSITLVNGFVSAGGSTCQISVPVTATSATDTTLTNITSSVSCFVAGGFCNGKAASADLFVAGAGIAPAITSGAPPPGTVGIPYAFQVTATGTPTPSVSASGLPPGLSFSSSTNRITGTPTTAGTFATTVVASNGVPPDATQTYSIVIILPLTIVIPGGSPTLPGAMAGQPYGPTTFTGAGGTPPYTWSACNQPPPPGLALSPGGTLSGTPTQVGSFTFDVCVTDSAGGKTSQQVTVVVAAVNTKIALTIAPNPGASGIPVIVTVKVSGASVVATGIVQFWMAGTGTKCPARFEAGKPTDPDAAMRTTALDASGRAQLTYANLMIDDYRVCVQYVGDGVYPPASAGPLDLAVIKGFLLPPPAVKLGVPAQAAPSAKMDAHVTVVGADATRVPMGSVRMLWAGSEIASANLVNGVAVIPIGMPTSGAVILTADYSGDSLYPPASSDSAVVVVKDVLLDGAGNAVIPTLQEWAMAVLALLVAMLGLRRLRRCST